MFAIFSTLTWGFKSILVRWSRLLNHLSYPFFKQANHLPPKDWWDWPVDLLFYSADCVFLADFLEILLALFKLNTRKLTELEVATLHQVYGDKVNLDFVKIDEKSRFFTRKFALAYVSFNTINYWHSMLDQVLVHEVMHIYQFQRYGSVYIYRALKAQYSEHIYDYGGITGLKKAREAGKSLHQFNFEQQASIIEDYYEISQRIDLLMVPGLVGLYQHFHEQL